MDSDSPLVDAYIRVSRRMGRAGPGYISIPIQREAIERWADYKSVQIAEWHIDEDETGGSHDRPGLDLAIGRALDGHTTGIVSWKIDRFSRLTEHGLRDLRRLQEAGARLAFVVEDIDTSAPIGKLVYTIMLAQGEYFLEQIKASWIAAKTRAVARGAFIGPTPYGYRRRDDSTLEPDPNTAAHVVEAYRIAAGRGPSAATRYLEANAPGRAWRTSTVRRLLAARSYLGETHHGQLIKTGTHEPLVSRPVWEAAQSSPVTREPAADFPLSGLPVCGSCGNPLIGSRGGTKGNRMRVYRCSATLSSSRNTCAEGVVIVADRLEQYLRERAEQILGGMRAEIGQPADVDRLALLERAITETEAELNAFAGDLTARRVLGGRYHEHLQARADAVDQAQAAYRQAASEAQANLVLEAPDVLNDPELLPIVLRNLFPSITVVRGRGLAVRDRVRLDPVDPDL